jgi:uncharacterized protein YkwD
MIRGALALLTVFAAACSHGTTKVGTQPSWRGGTTPKVTAQQLAPITFAPSTAAAVRYNEPFQAAPSSPLGDLVIAAVRDAAVKASLPVPAADARLFRACEELAQVVPEEGIVGYNVVEFSLQRNGIIEPSPHLLVVWGNIDEPELIVDQLRPRLPEILADGATTRVGIGAAKRNADGSGAVVFALQGSGVSTNPIPRSMKPGGSIALDAVVEARYREPELFITREDGSTERVDIAIGKSGGFKAQLACGTHRGKQQVEITASDQQGSTVLANFPVWCGAEPPASITVEPAGGGDNEAVSADEAERRLLALVNRDRQAAGLGAVEWDDKVAAVARKHSEEMQRTKVVAHISPTTGSAADRVRVAGIKTALVLENVARAYGVGEAHAGLMNSPGHRANVMSPLATHIGIGVVLGDEVSGRREMFVTQVFTRVPPKVDAAKTAQIVVDRINAARPVRSNPGLAAVAQDLATGLAAGKTRESLWPGAKKKLDSIGGNFARLGSVVTASADVSEIDGKELLGDYKADEIGVGIAQGPHPQIGDGAIWIVVLLAEKK